MTSNTDYVAAKLRRWEKYLNSYRLPAWEEIPDFGLYMDQVITLLGQYLDYLPPELKEEQFVTAATINNYVRTRVMPQPNKKRYYREHIAYLILILTLKQSLSIALIQKLIPMGLTSGELEQLYKDYAARHAQAAQYFVEQVELAAAPILHHEVRSAMATKDPRDMIISSAVVGGFARLLAEKLLLLEDAPEGEEKP